VVDEGVLASTTTVGKQFARHLERHGLREPAKLAEAGVLLDPAEFLSGYGLRSLSAYHRDHPYTIDVEGDRATIDYEPAESTTDMFGGNSNWRGPGAPDRAAGR